MRQMNIELVELISDLAHAVRQVLRRRGHHELFVPHLRSVPGFPLQDTVSFTVPGGRKRNFSGKLSPSNTYFLTESAKSHGKVFNLGPVFRADSPAPNRLIEFQYLELVSTGTSRDARKLTEAILKKMLAICIESGLPSKRHMRSLQRVKFPLQHVSFNDAMGILHADKPRCLSIEDQLQVTASYGHQPVFLVDAPQECMNQCCHHARIRRHL